MLETEVPLNLVKVPLRYRALISVARRRGIPLRDLDDGYLVHCVLKELWQEAAPAPFVLRSRGPSLEAWGYSASTDQALTEHARAFADPDLVGAIDEVAIKSRAIPALREGTRVGFHLRTSPVVRLSNPRGGYQAGAEVDAYQARCFADGERAPPREQVYREWLAQRLENTARSGAQIVSIRVAAFARESLVRRTQGAEREARKLERPITCFEGELEVKDGPRFREFIRHGVGRHRGFGFGALMVVPPGTPYPRR